MRIRRRFWALIAASATVALVGVSITTAKVAQAATGCRVTYTVTNQWPGGFGANVEITNLGDAVSSWNLVWSFAAGQSITQIWNATRTQNGSQVTANNVSYNGSVATNATVSFGFNGAWNASNPSPATFAFNGTTCTGSTSPSPSPSPSPSGGTGTLPSSFQWRSSQILISPKSDASHNLVSIKDPSVIFFNNRWHVYATTANTAGAWSLVYLNFADWSQAAAAPHFYLNNNPNIGNGYRAAPQVFFFAPQNRWYLVYQTGPPSFSTTTDPSQPQTWTAPQTFIANEPPIVTQNKGPGQWIDFWVICDATTCYLFFTDNNGHLYRSQTAIGNFPNGFNTPVIILQDSRFALFEAANVYKVKGQNRYLLIIEAIGSNGRRYFRSWTTDRLNGQWTALAATEANPFGRSNNVTFEGGTAWTQDISHGELIRDNNDQTLTINPCNLRYLYQGMNPSAGGEYSQLPWRLGLLTQTNSTC